MLSAAADSEITDVERASLSGHLKECPDCRAASASLEDARRKLASEPSRFSPSEFFNTRLSAAISSEAERRSALTFWKRLPTRAVYGFVSASAVAAILYITIPVFRGSFDGVEILSTPAVSRVPASVALLSDPEEDEKFDLALVDIYYGVAGNSDYNSNLDDENNDVSFIKGNREVV
jgi:predicted anti-sigma-YlaC factor YlaD